MLSHNMALSMDTFPTVTPTPLISKLQSPNVNQIWFADDASATADLRALRTWWDSLSEYGPAFGYFPNAQKSWIVVKEDRLEEAKFLFKDTEVNITKEGRRYLGSIPYVRSFIQEKVDSWVKEVQLLAQIANTQPHAAYAGYTHCTSNKWNFLLRTTPDIAELLQPFEDAILTELLPTMTGHSAINMLERRLFSLPACLGGLGIGIPTEQAEVQYHNSIRIASSLVDIITGKENMENSSSVKAAVQRQRQWSENEKQNHLMEDLPSNTKKAVELVCEKGASTWLTAMPIEEQGFFLYKGDFKDAMALRYGWLPQRLPKSCVCGQTFSVDHSLTCPCGGFPTLRHNEIRDITAELLSDVCHDVGVEPNLQPLSGESLQYVTTNREEGAHLDMVADCFWRNRKRAFFDIRVFHPFAPSYRKTPIATCYRAQERAKMRAYEQRVQEVEGGTISPLVFTTSGGMGPTATIVYKRIASMIAEKRDQPYSITMKWIRCRISFALIRSAIMCLRGNRSRIGHPIKTVEDMNVATAESHI